MKSLFIVESPLQLINAKEAIMFFNISKYKVIIRLSGIEINDMQIMNIVKKIDIPLRRISYVKVFASNGKRNVLKYIYISFLLLFKSILYKKIFLGNFDSKLFQLLLKIFKNHIILLDDGSKTLWIQKKFSELYNYDIFSIFKFFKPLSQKRYLNEYDYLKSIIKKNEYRKTDEVLFLGSKLNEVGYMNESEYLDLVKKILNHYPNSKIRYIAHRGENKDKLIKIKKRFNVKVEILDYPVELMCLYTKEIPKQVISFFSTALISLSVIYGDKINIVSYKFDYSNSVHKYNLDSIYNYYDNYIMVNKVE